MQFGQSSTPLNPNTRGKIGGKMNATMNVRKTLTEVCLAIGAFSLSTFAVTQNAEITLESRVTGNQEQPNVLSIVPWKQADDFQVIEQGFDEQFDRLFPHLEPTEFERRRYFATELEEEPTP